MKHNRPRRTYAIRAVQDKRLMPLALCFTAGAIVTSMLASGLDYSNCDFFIWTSGGSFLKILLSCIFGSILGFFAATSVLAPGLVPASSFLFGCLVALQSASIISAGDHEIARRIIFQVIIPGALLVPTFLLLAREGLHFPKCFVAGQKAPQRRAAMARMILAIAFSTTASLAAAAYIYLLLPQIL